MRSRAPHGPPLVRSAGGHLAPLGVALVALGLLAACGNQSGAAARVTAPPLTATETCPSGQSSMSIPGNAVIANAQTPSRTVTLSRGQILVVELSPQLRWSYDPAASHAANLTTRMPTGALDSEIGVCFWQWQAQSTGMATLVFNGQQNCTASQQTCSPLGQSVTTPTPDTSTGSSAPSSTVLPGYSTNVSFTVNVH